MFNATIVENSLADKSILKELEIIKSWQSDDWTLHNVLVKEDQIGLLSKYLDNGPWYIHLWKEGDDEIKVVFKDKIFNIKHSDKSSWSDAVVYGKSIGIPEEQLDFIIEE